MSQDAAVSDEATWEEGRVWQAEGRASSGWLQGENVQFSLMTWRS